MEAVWSTEVIEIGDVGVYIDKSKGIEGNIVDCVEDAAHDPTSLKGGNRATDNRTTGRGGQVDLGRQGGLGHAAEGESGRQEGCDETWGGAKELHQKYLVKEFPGKGNQLLRNN